MVFLPDQDVDRVAEAGLISRTKNSNEAEQIICNRQRAISGRNRNPWRDACCREYVRG
jgi:hypothetical protein